MYWARLGFWISPFYGPFSLGARFETYEEFISLIFQFSFSGRSKPRITESVDTGAEFIILSSILFKFLGLKPKSWRG
jgi:hypothetical protein